MTNLEINEVVLVQCNIVNNNYQQDQESCIHLFLIYSFGQLQDISPKNFTFLKTFNSELSYIEVWFTDHNFKPLEIEIKENITLVINQIVKYKKWHNIQFRLKKEYW